MIAAVSLLAYTGLLLTAGASQLVRAPALAAPLALGAGGSATGARIRRLLRTSAPLGLPRAAAGMVALAIVVAFPFLALSGPALTLIGSHCINTASSATHSAAESSD